MRNDSMALHISVMTKSRPRETSAPSVSFSSSFAIAVYRRDAEVGASEIYSDGIITHIARVLLSEAATTW